VAGRPNLFAAPGAAVGAAAGGALGGGLSAAAIGEGLAIGAVSGLASQAVLLATGAESRFNWGAVALSAIGGGVSGGLASGPLQDLDSALPGGPGGFLSTFANGAISNVVTQGIGVATGLQNSFDWTSVATSGIEGGIMGATKNPYLGSAAALLAGATTRTLLTGQNFGQSLLQEAPNTVAPAIGDMLGSTINDALNPIPDGWKAWAGPNSSGGGGLIEGEMKKGGAAGAYTANLLAQGITPGGIFDPQALSGGTYSGFGVNLIPVIGLSELSESVSKFLEWAENAKTVKETVENVYNAAQTTYTGDLSAVSNIFFGDNGWIAADVNMPDDLVGNTQIVVTAHGFFVTPASGGLFVIPGDGGTHYISLGEDYIAAPPPVPVNTREHPEWDDPEALKYENEMDYQSRDAFSEAAAGSCSYLLQRLAALVR
jgi:hypothetical protein